MIKLFKNLLVFTFIFFTLQVSAQNNKQVGGFEGVHILIDGVKQDSVVLKNLKKENIADAEVYKDADILKAFNLNRSSRGVIIVTTKANINSFNNATLKKKMENIFSDRIRNKKVSDSLIAEGIVGHKIKADLDYISKSSPKKFKYIVNGNDVTKDSIAKITRIRIDKIEIKEQERKDVLGEIKVILRAPFNADHIYNFADISKQPEYPGGLQKFYDYLNEEIKYPKEDLKNGISGRVFLSFIVEKDGSLNDISITRGLSAGTNFEAKRALQESGKWIPGFLEGQPVRTKYNININFSANK